MQIYLTGTPLEEELTGMKRERVFWATAGFGIILLSLVLLVPVYAFGQEEAEETDRLLQVFSQVFRFVEDNYVDIVDTEQLFEGAMKGLFESLDDPHSYYLSAQEMRDLSDTTQGEFGGVGMYISKQVRGEEDDRAAYVEIVSPIDGTPADRAGLRSGDLIVEIEDESTEDLTIDEVVNRLRGRPGTPVSISVRRGERQTFPVTLQRDIIEVPTVRTAMIPDDIAFLRIIQFTPHTAERVRDAIAEFEDEGYESLIIDLRRNPGGLLNGVVETADLFFDGGIIVGTRGRNPRENEMFAANSGQRVPEDLPIVVLIDEGSASAAEIMAGALKDRNRATLIGETTYGKGSVQQVRRIGEGGFRLTMSRYYTPSGAYIDQTGVSPDREVSEPELSEEQIEDYAMLIEQDTVAGFITQNPNPTNRQIDRFIADMRSEGIDLPERVLRKLVRDEINRRNDQVVVYDLEYDLVLQEAVRMLR